jgi:hypothetical protein
MPIAFDNDVEMVSHRAAPFSDLCAERPRAMYDEAVRLITSTDLGNASEDDIDIIRSVALCNLHFFLKYVAGYSGPYDEINDDLQMEMCNWRQRALAPGARYAGFVPRSSMKSTTWTHGAVTWELLRNPDLRVGIFSATIDRAQDFMHTVQRNFDSNDLMAALFPDHCPDKAKRGTQWNDVIAVMPNRSRSMPEPSLRAHTASGTTAGIHVDLAQFDDIVSDSQLNSDRHANAEMTRIGHWFKTAVPTLLRSQDRSRVVLAATRYDIEDPYEDIMLDARVREGDWTGLDGFYPRVENGTWNVYYRTWNVDGESIFPDAYTVESMMKLAKEDPWTYITQYVNNPHNVATQEFGAYSLRRCWLEYDDEQREWYIKRDDQRRVPLSLCDVVAGADPAASDKRVSRKTSRSAIAVIARCPDDCVYIIDARCDYVDTVKMMDWFFALRRRFSRDWRVMKFEAAGPFKLMVSLLRREEQLRQTDLNFLPIPSLGEKLSTIRLIWEPFLKRGSVFVCDSVWNLVSREFNVFPSQMLDLMDAVKIAISATHSVAEDDDGHYDDDDDAVQSAFAKRHVASTGY